MLKFITEDQFERDLKKTVKRGKNIQKLKDIVELLLNNKNLPQKNRNHKLQGDYKNCWECHIEPDWLLIYKKTLSEIILIRTGTHSDLF